MSFIKKTKIVATLGPATSSEEIIKNKASRSAKLRFAVRSKDKFQYPDELIKKFKKYLDLEVINV